MAVRYLASTFVAQVLSRALDRDGVDAGLLRGTVFIYAEATSLCVMGEFEVCVGLGVIRVSSCEVGRDDEGSQVDG